VPCIFTCHKPRGGGTRGIVEGLGPRGSSCSGPVRGFRGHGPLGAGCLSVVVYKADGFSCPRREMGRQGHGPARAGKARPQTGGWIKTFSGWLAQSPRLPLRGQQGVLGEFLWVGWEGRAGRPFALRIGWVTSIPRTEPGSSGYQGENWPGAGVRGPGTHRGGAS